jgi:hypothetical protein
MAGLRSEEPLLLEYKAGADEETASYGEYYADDLKRRIMGRYVHCILAATFNLEPAWNEPSDLAEVDADAAARTTATAVGDMYNK